MNAGEVDAVRRVADAVLYEGYVLYPYRASARKNRSRWQFGVIMAPGYAGADPSERSFAQAECVIEHAGQPAVEVVLRFLQVQRRSADGAPDWDEAVEREVTVGPAGLLGQDRVTEFSIPGGEDREGGGTGVTVRRRAPLAGAVSVQAVPVPGPWRAARLRVRAENRAETGAVPRRREDALPTALVAAHMIISVAGGQFVPMTDPPMWARPAVAECENTGGWPVLAERGRRVVLWSPIILYDYPELAPESPGELYDGTEIDEILTLRTLALSDAEKAEARATDPRAAALIDRVESLDEQAMARLHGAVRSLRPAAGEPGSDEGWPGAAGSAGGWSGAAGSAGGWPGAESSTGGRPRAEGSTAGRPGAESSTAGRPGAEGSAAGSGETGRVPWWDPDADASVSPETDTVEIGGRPVGRGSRVRLRPGARRADAQDMFLAGRIAEVQAVLFDVDDHPYLAVSLADDPDADLRIAHGRFLYFGTDEVEPCEAEGTT